ncbi:MAG: TonB-dependent receptor [Pyrinomonadaceae bacterium]|nr:TonB-dependent receptor [Pyrinomonadaceae bacterium]
MTDSTGAIVPGAQITAVNVANNQTMEVTTNEEGLYQVPSLQPGNYQLKVSAPGFSTVLRENVTLRVEDRLRLDVTLETGGVSATVSVTGIPLIESETPSLGQVISERAIRDLPIRGRNVFDLVGLSPGVQVNPRSIGQVASTGDNSAPLFVLSDISINGGRTRTNEFLLDGVTLVLPENNNYALSPTPDGTQEFKVITNSYGPQFGRSGGGVVNVITKSGDNDFHGTAYELFRNDRLRANNYFANARGQKRGLYRFNLFGGTLGGPIKRDRTFFFAEYQGHRESSEAGGQVLTVPTGALRAGDFRGLLNAQGQPVIIYDPFTTRPNPSGSGSVRSQISCNGVPNVICPNRFDPVAAKLLSFLPLPNRPGEGPAQINNFTYIPLSIITSNQWSGRIDHRFSEKHNIFVRATRNTGFSHTSGPFNSIADNVLGDTVSRAFNAVVNDTYTFNPNRLLNLRYGFTRRFEGRTPLSAGQVDLLSLGFPARVASAAQEQLFPRIDIAGFASLGAGGDRIHRGNDIHAIVADVTEIRGRHTFNFGGDFRLYNQTPFQAGGNPSGAYSFGANFTQGPNPLASSLVAGSGLASFLLGYGGGNIISTPALAIRNYYYAFYANDDIKFRKLTLNIGLRYDYEQPRTERYDRFATFDFDAPFPIQVPGLSGLRGILTHPGQNDEPRGNFDGAHGNFGPRLGLAYRLNDKTSLRAGYGVFYLQRIGATSPGTFGVSGYELNTPYISSLDGITPLNPISNPFPNGLLEPITSEVGRLQLGQSIAITDRNSKTNSYTQHWNASVQRELPGRFIVEGAYAGNKGTRLPVGLQFNQLDPKYQSLGADLNTQVTNPFFGLVQTGVLANRTVARGQLLRPFPQYNGVSTFQQMAASSIYHSFTIRSEKRFSQGINLLLAYTGSKLIDNSSGRVFGVTQFNPPVQNAYDLSAERSLSEADVARRLVFSHTLELPIGRGRALFGNSSGFVDKLIGGWSLSGIATIHSGYPLALTSNGNSGVFGGVLRPNSIGRSAGLTGPVESRLTKFFDTSAFTIPAPFTFGNTSRTLPDVRGPGRRNYDLTLSKTFPIKEPVSLLFRAEAFNLTNTPYFFNPGTNLGAANFGVISAASGERQVQFTLKLLF